MLEAAGAKKEDLLVLARSDQGRLPLRRERVDLDGAPQQRPPGHSLHQSQPQRGEDGERPGDDLNLAEGVAKALL